MGTAPPAARVFDPKGIEKFEVGCGMGLVMDGGYGYEISSASDDEPMRKLSI